MTDITKHASWKALNAHRQQEMPCLNDLFSEDAGRFAKFSLSLPGLLADFSKNLITEETKALLVSLAEEADLEEAREAFFRGEKVNSTENRPALHMALRAPLGRSGPGITSGAGTALGRSGPGITSGAGTAPGSGMAVDGCDVTLDVHRTLARMRSFAEAVRNGEWRGHSGKQMTDIVNIGIGGSTLGPQLATEALSSFHHPLLTCHYVANVDASDLARVLKKLSPETTLFIIASKTFTTAETMQNARLARDWLMSHYADGVKPVSSHFAAASTNAEAVTAFGIAPGNMFPFQDWVGGRYSVWSSIGLSTMVMIGQERFSEFLSGAHEMDTHFRTAPLGRNLPVMLALIGIWNRNFLGFPAYAVIPYHATLRRLPAFLQQLDMESNGKSVTRSGAPVAVRTGPMVFGEPGTDAQHIFFQWLHQSPDVVPVDFIAAIRTAYDTPEQRNMLLANLLAQSEALMTGKNDPEPYRRYAGNRPSTTLLFDEINPRALGLLLALYEHKVFTQGILWGINSFDQWGVTLGKELAKTLEDEITRQAPGRSGPGIIPGAGTAPGRHDGSTAGLLNHILENQSFRQAPETGYRQQA